MTEVVDGDAKSSVAILEGLPGNAVRSVEQPLHKLLEFDDQIKLDTTCSDLVKGLFGPGDLVALYGPSGVGKTFIALDLAYAISRGRDFWLGRRVRSKPVLYIGLEGQRGLRHRMLAAAEHFGYAQTRFARLTVSPRLNHQNGSEGVDLIARAAGHLAELSGESVGLIIIDTLARAMAGDDENSSQDITAFMTRMDELVRLTGAAVMVVHHPGKDESRGMRGSYALLGAVDTVIKIEKTRHIEIEKARDDEIGPLADYRLRKVALGIDEDGDDITTCLVDVVTGVFDTRQPVKRLTAQPARAMQLLERLFEDGAGQQVSAHEIDLSGAASDTTILAMAISEWQAKCATARLVPEGKAASERMAFKRAIEQLESAGRIARFDKWAWLTDSAATSRLVTCDAA
jgi:hypothetical protein